MTRRTALRCGRCGGAIAWLACGIALLSSAVALGQASDRVIAVGVTITGKVVGSSANGIEIEDRNGDVKKVPIDKVREVQFGGEPKSLRDARSFVARGRGADALEELAKVDKAELDGAEPAVLAEMQFVKAAGEARAALDSGDKIDEAAAIVSGFLAKNPKSHHTYDLQQLLGDLLARSGKFGDAASAYAVLAKGPAAFQVRAATAKAGLFFAQEKYDDAIKEYDAALKITADDDESVAQKQAALLGKARSLSRLGKHADGVALIETIIKQANPEAKDLLAKAYTTLGSIYRAMGGKDQDALIAYLTVDLVYNSVAESHAEALYNLAELWENGKNPERAIRSRENLTTAYPASPWKKKLEAGGKAL